MGVCCRLTGLPNPSVPWWGDLIFLHVPPALEANVRSGAEAGGGGVSSWPWRGSLRRALRLASSPESGEAPDARRQHCFPSWARAEGGLGPGGLAGLPSHTGLLASRKLPGDRGLLFPSRGTAAQAPRCRLPSRLSRMDTGGAASPPPQGQCPVMLPSGHHGSPRADSWLDPAPGPGLGVRVCSSLGRPAAGQPTLRGLTCPLGTFLPASGLGRVVMSHSSLCRPPCLRSVLASAWSLPPLLPCGFGLVSVLLHLCVSVFLSPLFLCAPLPSGINYRCAGGAWKRRLPFGQLLPAQPPTHVAAFCSGK